MLEVQGGCVRAGRTIFFLAIKANALYLEIFLSGDDANIKEVSAINAVLIMQGVQRSGSFWLAR